MITEAQRNYYLHQYEEALKLCESSALMDEKDECRIVIKTIQSKSNYCLSRKGTSYIILTSLIDAYGHCAETAPVLASLARQFPWLSSSIDWAIGAVNLASELPESHTAFLTALLYSRQESNVEKAEKYLMKNANLLDQYNIDYCEMLLYSSLGHSSSPLEISRRLLLSNMEPIDFTRIFYFFCVLAYRQTGSIDAAVAEGLSLLNELSTISNADVARAHLMVSRLYLLKRNYFKAVDFLESSIHLYLKDYPSLWWLLGWINYRLKDRRSAIQAFEKCIELLEDKKNVYTIAEEGWDDLHFKQSLTGLSVCYLMRFRFIKSLNYFTKLSSSCLRRRKKEDSDIQELLKRVFTDFDIP